MLRRMNIPTELSQEQKDLAKANPKKELQVPFLNEIDNIYEIYKNGKLIGYALNLDDHVDAAMIQDGSGFVLLLDVEMTVVAHKAWHA